MDDTALSLLAGRRTPAEAAQAAGFASPAAFARAFDKRYLAPPEAFAAARAAGRLALRYGGPFDARKTLDYLGRDPENQAELVQGRRYTRWFTLDGMLVKATLELSSRHGTLLFRPGLAAARVLALHRTVLHLLGLRQPLADFRRHTRGHPVLGPIVQAMPGVRIIQTPSLWEALSWAIMGQQINLAFAYRLRNRLIHLANGHAQPAPRPLPFPAPAQVLALHPQRLREAQFSRQKIDYLHELARQFDLAGLDALTPETVDAERSAAALQAIRGLGPWSVAYGLMRGLGCLDALPVGDAGLRQALRLRFNLDAPPDVATQQALMEPFRPYRSLATYYLWKSLNPANLM